MLACTDIAYLLQLCHAPNSKSVAAESACGARQRLAVYEAARLLRDHEPAYKALQEAMQRGASVPDCIRAIEGARGSAGGE